MDADDEITLFASKPTKRKKEAKASIQSKKEHLADYKEQSECEQESSREQAVASISNEQEGSREQAIASTSDVSFNSLGVNDWLSGVCKSLGITNPTGVQRACIPEIFKGRDVIGLAETGSGKTAAFALPMLQKLAKDPYGIYGLVLTPTRELAIQIAEQFKALGAGMNIKTCTIIGGLDMQKQAKEMSRRPHVIISTPGRLMGLLLSDSNLATGFAHLRFLVLDEADRLLDPTFEGPLRTILAALPEERQTLLFSATMTKALIKLQKAALADAFIYKAYEGLKTVERLREEYLLVPLKVKEVYLHHLITTLPDQQIRSAIIFCSTCRGCHALSMLLEELGHSCTALHSGRSQKERLAALQRFKSQAVPLLLATDVASRGLDIPTVDLVVNFDLPMAARDYIHRVGRTARAGRGGRALSFVTQHDVELVQRVEQLIGHQLAAAEMDEATVMKSITKVYNAKRVAMLRIAEEEGLDTRASRGMKRVGKRQKS